MHSHSLIACCHGCPQLPAAVYQQAVQGCQLTNCSDKAAVLYFVQQALKNTTNAYLAYISQEQRSFSTLQDFVQRADLFSATLVQVAQLNARLTDYFVSGSSSCRPAGQPAGTPNASVWFSLPYGRLASPQLFLV